MDVGVRELKQSLSRYIERAARGEVIRVTDRGVPRAILGPVPGTAHLAEGIAAGWVTAGQEAPVAKVRAGKSAKRVCDVLSEDRGT